MAVIQFNDVGSGHYSGAVQVSNGLSVQEIAEIAYEEARKRLLSSGVYVEYDDTKNEGIVRAGFHTVGTFKVV